MHEQPSEAIVLARRVVNESKAAVDSQNANEARHHTMRAQMAYDQIIEMPTEALIEASKVHDDLPALLEDAWENCCALADAEKRAEADGTTAAQRLAEGGPIEPEEEYVVGVNFDVEGSDNLFKPRTENAYRRTRIADEGLEQAAGAKSTDMEAEPGDIVHYPSKKGNPQIAVVETVNKYYYACVKLTDKRVVMMQKVDVAKKKVFKVEKAAPAAEPDPNQPVGVLYEGHALCHGCANKAEDPAPLFAINLGQYKQSCASCGGIIAEGSPGWPELFDGRPQPANEVELAAARASYAAELGVGNPDDAFAMAFGEWAQFLKESIATGGVRAPDLTSFIVYGAGSRKVREVIVSTWRKQNGYCQIQWIDGSEKQLAEDSGMPYNATPDLNPAIGTVRCRFQNYPGGYPGPVTYSEEILICKEHAKRLPGLPNWEWVQSPGVFPFKVGVRVRVTERPEDTQIPSRVVGQIGRITHRNDAGPPIGGGMTGWNADIDVVFEDESVWSWDLPTDELEIVKEVK